LWTGEFKGLDSGDEDYEITPHIWEQVGEETAAASWCFWFVYLAPILLHGRFKEDKYYDHMCQLVELMKTMLRLQITMAAVGDIKNGLSEWVQKYEQCLSIDQFNRYYYQYKCERLSVCTLTAHGLLHVADGIRDCGPVWCTWSFYMERFCHVLQSGPRSVQQPWSHLNNRLLHMTYLEQLAARFDLEDELQAVNEHIGDGPIGYERSYPEYADYVLRPPYTNIPHMSQDLERRLAIYFSQVLGKRTTEVTTHLGLSVLSTGKFRIRHGGDSFRTEAVSKRTGQNERKNCYVRYEILQYSRGVHEPICKICYGHLDKILVYQVPNDPFFGILSGKEQVLVLLTPWKTDGQDAAKTLTWVQAKLAPIITDIRNIKAVVGLVDTRKRSGIIDR
ncbi:hypothetical protein DEU56DRAFT_692461, partial [Suillus clintonianus]|uniref:uncharacterized protein n=1 Tax=Suillus clintonianus TaxID=1904413 RepID=UPI001B864C5C